MTKRASKRGLAEGVVGNIFDQDVDTISPPVMRKALKRFTKKARPVPTSGNPYKQDLRVDNPALHLLYVKTAVTHLWLIDQIIQSLWDTSNGNLLGMVGAVVAERDKLIAENAAYADANEIFQSLQPEKNDVPIE